jgi:RND family efflux transporter MFP subunit
MENTMHRTLIGIICISLLALASIGGFIFIKTAPTAEKKSPPKMAALVETLALEATNETVMLELTGTVVPNEDVMLRARVGGEIVSTAPEFVEGGLFKKGEPILSIDPVDFELALIRARSALETARFNYKLELGRQDVAQREWELLKSNDATDMEKELALRIPHIAASKAALEAAEASVKKAELDLERTQIHSPFNAIVLSANVNAGSQAAVQDVLAKIAGTDSYWIIVSIPVDRLSWVSIPGSQAKVVSASGAERTGRVIKLLGDLEEQGRMARLLLQVDDPLCLKPENTGKKPLLLDEYVRTEIKGRELQNVYSIPRKALHENKLIWIAEDGKLDIREVEVLWRDARQALVRDGLADGELLIVSDLTTPIQDMDVNTGIKSAQQE